ncbi:UNVERIFIED_CONTAM: hypothetical protein FKN15_003407 [Acipenser sinensis]
MLGHELHTPVELALGCPPDAPSVPLGPEYARRLRDQLESAHHFRKLVVPTGSEIVASFTQPNCQMPASPIYQSGNPLN